MKAERAAIRVVEILRGVHVGVPARGEGTRRAGRTRRADADAPAIAVGAATVAAIARRGLLTAVGRRAQGRDLPTRAAAGPRALR
jgi:hypothetical protein